jgi:septal ring factor EnvC (AmiA/AmiB activator)
MIKKIHFLSLAVLSFAVLNTAGLHAKMTDEQKAERKAAAIAEVKELIGGLTAETNKLTEALNAAQKGKEVVQALDSWANYLDGWKKSVKNIEGKKGFKFLKQKEPPEEIKPDLEAFMASVNTMSETLQAKVELFKDNPKFQKRIQQVLAKLKDM